MKKQRENSAPLKSDEVSSKPSGCEFEPYESLTLKDNFIFTKVMSDPANCRGFLLRAFPDLDIGKVTAVQESTHQTAYGSKGVRFDVYASDGSKIFDLEMQIVDKKDLPQRARYYNCTIDSDQLEKGEDYPVLKKVYIIFICTFPLPYGNLHKYTFRRYALEDKDTALNDGTELIFYTTKGTADDLDSSMQHFLDYIDSVPASHIPDAYITQLDESVRNAKMKPDWRRQYMDLKMWLQDQTFRKRLIFR